MTSDGTRLHVVRHVPTGRLVVDYRAEVRSEPAAAAADPARVSSWVGQHLVYVGGSSRHTDGAVRTYLAREGACLDYAAVYAPGLQPMDFHVVAEAWLDGDWYVVDATALVPREGLLRTVTGRDA